ncbi:hypothetical protein JOC78_002863 [Bacillus ectoiniformans]|nr:hypothetical protein [Bacillus ectoiniformans]
MMIRFGLMKITKRESRKEKSDVSYIKVIVNDIT